jgi:FSR family fosmidomycin resistance protein-like MFS transporter
MTSSELPPLDRTAHWKPVAALTASHALIDLCQGMVPALLPFLVADLGFTYAAGAGLVFATSAASSIIQPLFGHVADRWTFRWLLPVSVLLTGAGLALGSQSPHYAVFFLALVISGLGVAAFHPEAARQIHLVTGPGRSTEMSVFAFGGGLGFALAPLVTTGLLVAIGRIGTLIILIPTGVFAVLLASQFSLPATIAPSIEDKETGAGQTQDRWAGFVVLSLVTICRSIVFAGLNTFLALYWMSRWAVSPSAGATILGLFLGTGLCGTLLGGRMADVWGRRPVLRAGFGTAAVLLPLLLLATDSLWAMLLLVILAVAFFTPSGLLVVLGQEYLPNRIGVAAGVTLGLAVSVGGTMAPLLGVLADREGVGAVMLVVEAVLVVAVLLALMLPQVSPKAVPYEEEDGPVLSSSGLEKDSL